MIFIDFSQQGVLPVITDLFQSAADFTNNAPRNLSGGSNSSSKRIIVLYDEFWICHPYGFSHIPSTDVVSTPQTLFKVHDWYKRVNHYIYYSGSGSSIGNARQGNLFAIIGGSRNLAVTPAFDVVWKYSDP